MKRLDVGFFLLIFYAFPLSAIAQESGNAWDIHLDSITIKGHRYSSPLKTKADGSLIWNMQQMGDLPKTLSNADPMHYAQMLPAIQTNNEYRSGINIEGCDNQHSLISIGGVPVYNVNHLLGFFSTFNASHYPSMSVTKSAHSAEFSNRLGGQLDMSLPIEVADSASGEFSLGLISSQGTIRLPMTDRTSLVVSLRCSFMNLVYSQWLKADGQQVKYSFYDANATLTHRLNRHHTILLDFYSGNDNGGFEEEHYLANMKAKWGNTMGSLYWIYDSRQELKAATTLYYTSYHNRFSLAMQDMQVALPSGIADIGIKSNIKWSRFKAGMEAVCHDVQPQSYEHNGDFNISDGKVDNVHALETSLFVDYSQPIMQSVSLSAGIRGNLFNQSDYTHTSLNPSFHLLYDNQAMQFNMAYAYRHQYMFQMGFSDMGLPTEFWTSATRKHKPQYAHEFFIGGNSLVWEHRFKISVDLFYKKLYNQLEYYGSLLDYVNMTYDIDRSVFHGNGENYGFALMVNKCSGHLTGWISYTNTHARRCFDEIGQQKYYPANHERIHELNAVATYTFNRHWSFGGTLVYASGTPFTPVQSLYLLNNNIVMDYGEHNAARLGSYARMDVSANYKWASNSMEHGINVSLYNVTSRENELFYKLKTRHDGTFAYRPVTFILRILPSISYFCKF